MTEKVVDIDEVQKALVDFTGSDCYAETILFPNGDTDKEAFAWLLKSMQKIIERKRPNAEKAERVVDLVERIMLHGYVDHLRMHAGKKLKADNKKLRETVDHLTTKLSET